MGQGLLTDKEQTALEWHIEKRLLEANLHPRMGLIARSDPETYKKNLRRSITEAENARDLIGWIVQAYDISHAADVTKPRKGGRSH